MSTLIWQALLRCYEQDRRIDNDMSALFTHVGHAKVTETYWYLTGTPQLMAIAAQRFDALPQNLSGTDH